MDCAVKKQEQDRNGNIVHNAGQIKHPTAEFVQMRGQIIASEDLCEYISARGDQICDPAHHIAQKQESERDHRRDHLAFGQ